MAPQTAPEPSQADEVVPLLASIGLRAGARIIDSLLLGVLGSLVFWLSVTVIEPPESQFYFDSLSWVLSAAGAVYEIALTKARGQTVGKMALKIRVVRQDRTSLPGWWSSIVRYGLPAIVGGAIGFAIRPLGPETSALLGFLIAPAIYLTAALDRNRQGIHDKAARTIVVSDGQGPVLPVREGSVGEEVG